MVQEIGTKQQEITQQDLTKADTELRKSEEDLRKLQEDIRKSPDKLVTLQIGEQQKTISKESALKDIEIEKRRISVERSKIPTISRELKEFETAVSKFQPEKVSVDPTKAIQQLTPEEQEALKLSQEIEALKKEQPPVSRISRALGGMARKGFEISERIGERVKGEFQKPMTFDVVGKGPMTFKPGIAEKGIGAIVSGVATAPIALVSSAIATVPVVESIARKPIQLVTTVPKGLKIAGVQISKAVKKKPVETIGELIGGAFVLSRIPTKKIKLFKKEQIKVPVTEQLLISKTKGKQLIESVKFTPESFRLLKVGTRSKIIKAVTGKAPKTEGYFLKRISLVETVPKTFKDIQISKLITTPEKIISKVYVSEKIPRVLKPDISLTRQITKIKEPYGERVMLRSEFAGEKLIDIVSKTKAVKGIQRAKVLGLVGRRSLYEHIEFFRPKIKPVKPKEIKDVSKLKISEVKDIIKTAKDIWKKEPKKAYKKVPEKVKIFSKDMPVLRWSTSDFEAFGKLMTKPPEHIKDFGKLMTKSPEHIKDFGKLMTKSPEHIKEFGKLMTKPPKHIREFGKLMTKPPEHIREFGKIYKKPRKIKKYIEQETILKSPFLKDIPDYSKVFTTKGYRIETLPEIKITKTSHIPIPIISIKSIEKAKQLSVQRQKPKELQKYKSDLILEQRPKITQKEKAKERAIYKFRVRQKIKVIPKIKVKPITVIIKPIKPPKYIPPTKPTFKPYRPKIPKIFKIRPKVKPRKIRISKPKKKGFKLKVDSKLGRKIFTKEAAIQKGLLILKKQPKIKEFRLKRVLGVPKKIKTPKITMKVRREVLKFKRRL